MKNLLVFALFIIFLSSCKKEEISSSLPISSSENLETTVTSDETTDTKTTSSSILNATSASQIPSEFFKIDLKYKNAYIHMGQPDQTSCSWTSYMLSVGAIARGNGNSYACSSNKVYAIKNKCNNSSSITKLCNFGTVYDSQYITAIYENGAANTTGRFIAIKKMLSHINTYHKPFLVIGTYYKSNGTKVAHYLVVHSIDWKCGGTGSTVYYTDCAYNFTNNNQSLDANLKQMNLSLFLDCMIDSPNSYNMLFFR